MRQLLTAVLASVTALALLCVVGCGRHDSESYRRGQQHGMDSAMKMCEQKLQELAVWRIPSDSCPPCPPCPKFPNFVIANSGDSIVAVGLYDKDGNLVQRFVPEAK